MKKWKIGLAIGSSTLVAGLGSAVLFNGLAHGEWDLPGLNQQVQHVTEVTQNHEGRITNLENQANTPSGQPTPTPEVVTKVVTEQAPQTAVPVNAAPATAAPAPVPAKTIVSTEHIQCAKSGPAPAAKVILTTYSDGSADMTQDGAPYTEGCVRAGTW